MKPKKLKTYELYDGPFGRPTPRSVFYGRFTKRIIKVRAVSIKQAVFLAAHGTKSTGPETLGIYEVLL